MNSTVFIQERFSVSKSQPLSKSIHIFNTIPIRIPNFVCIFTEIKSACYLPSSSPDLHVLVRELSLQMTCAVSHPISKTWVWFLSLAHTEVPDTGKEKAMQNLWQEKTALKKREKTKSHKERMNIFNYSKILHCCMIKDCREKPSMQILLEKDRKASNKLYLNICGSLNLAVNYL